MQACHAAYINFQGYVGKLRQRKASAQVSHLCNICFISDSKETKSRGPNNRLI